jgi:hypothetical protein
VRKSVGRGAIEQLCYCLLFAVLRRPPAGVAFFVRAANGVLTTNNADGGEKAAIKTLNSLGCPIGQEIASVWLKPRILKSEVLEREIALLCFNVEIAIDFKRRDLFRETERLFCFGRRYYCFLAVDIYAKRHGKARNDSLVLE